MVNARKVDEKSRTYKRHIEEKTRLQNEVKEVEEELETAARRQQISLE